MINGVEVKSAFSGDATSALARVAEELAALGYELSKNDGGELEMKFKGKWFTSDPAKMKHKVTVKAEADHLLFAFGTGLIASHWSDEDRAWAQTRADDVASAVGAKMNA